VILLKFLQVVLLASRYWDAALCIGGSEEKEEED